MPKKRGRERRDNGTFAPSQPPLSTHSDSSLRTDNPTVVETSTEAYSSPSQSSEDSRDTLHYAPETPVSTDNPFDEQCIDNTMAEPEPTAAQLMQTMLQFMNNPRISRGAVESRKGS